MSNLSLERLLFDRSDVAGSPQLGSHILGDSSALVTSHTVVSDIGLDVYLLNTSLAVTQSGTWSVQITDGVDTLAIDASGFLTVNVNGTVAVTQSGTWTVGFNADADDAAATYNPIGVGGVAYAQSAALGVLSAAGDRGHMLMDLYRRIFINDAPNRAVASVNVAIDDTAGGTAFVATELLGRTRVIIQNLGSDPVYVGPTGLTASNGLQIAKGGSLSLEAGEAIALFGIAPAGKTVNCRVFELA